MSDEKDKKPADEGEERTVFVPASPDGGPGGPAPGTAPAAPAAPAEPAAPGKPKKGGRREKAAEPAPPAQAAAAPAPPATAAPEATVVAPAAGAAAATAFAPREHAQAIKVGDVLNHIFEVKRFLARGGMGEVFEGCNVNTDEKVAIKVMLPALAADEKVVAMFRKEARTLTKLHHEAIVQYRVLAQEPVLGVLYIVTDFIEGDNLADVLATLQPGPDDLAGLLRRLAAGLGAAHRLGAVHRDMSPDNVILAKGDIHQAKIIDFGIAKDLDASAATIVGDGFAGKLNYVAPEQLGDYGREIGPWTDVYSLALVILAVARGKNVDMSGSLVDAIDKRRKGPDLSPVPDELRPLVAAMLRPDPKERLRSMDEVLARLGGAAAPAPLQSERASAPGAGGSGASKGLIVGGVLAAALVVGAGAWYMLAGPSGVTVSPAEGPAGSAAAPPSGAPADVARAAINSALPSVSCTWLDIGGVAGEGGDATVAMRGVAGDSAAAQRELSQALAAAGLPNARLDFGDVAPITPAGCAALDTYRQVRASSDYRLSVSRPRYEMALQPAGLPYAGRDAANAVVNFNFSDPALDFAILGIEPSGAITPLIASRERFEAALAQSVGGRPIADEGDGRYRLNIDLDHEGWSGIILVTGRGPFPADTVAPPIGARGPSWQREFLTAAAERDWRVEMAWFQSVDRVEGDRAPIAPGGAAGGSKP